MLEATSLIVMKSLFEILKRREIIKNLDLETDFLKVKLTKKQQISDLIEAYKDEKLTLVLGAGVSIEHGLPSWNVLLQKLLINTFATETNDDTKEKSIVLSKLFTKIFSPSPLISGRYLKKYYQDFSNTNLTTSFEEAVREAIYEEIDIEKQSDLFKEIRQLCAAPGRNPSLDSIITYNYDDLLEKYLLNLDIDIPFKSIHSIGDNPVHGELPIYHVHGFLPQDIELNENNKITLSEDIYHQQYNEIYSWNNIIQINKFRDNMCLFFGISFTDPNLRRLLDIAKLQKGESGKYHYLIRKKYEPKIIEDEILKILEKDQELYGDKVKAQLELDETVKHLVNIMEKFEENDAISFGVRTIWIKDYMEIPKILKSIRKFQKNE